MASSICNGQQQMPLHQIYVVPSGFVEEMRFVAMKLHTKDQAPKEGGKEASKHPMREVILWLP